MICKPLELLQELTQAFIATLAKIQHFKLFCKKLKIDFNFLINLTELNVN